MHNSKPESTSKEAKSGQIIRIEQEQLNRHLDKVVRGTVERNSLIKIIILSMFIFKEFGKKMIVWRIFGCMLSLS